MRVELRLKKSGMFRFVNVGACFTLCGLVFHCKRMMPVSSTDLMKFCDICSTHTHIEMLYFNSITHHLLI